MQCLTYANFDVIYQLLAKPQALNMDFKSVHTVGMALPVIPFLIGMSVKYCHDVICTTALEWCLLAFLNLVCL